MKYTQNPILLIKVSTFGRFRMRLHLLVVDTAGSVLPKN